METVKKSSPSPTPAWNSRPLGSGIGDPFAQLAMYCSELRAGGRYTTAIFIAFLLGLAAPDGYVGLVLRWRSALSDPWRHACYVRFIGRRTRWRVAAVCAPGCGRAPRRRLSEPWNRRGTRRGARGRGRPLAALDRG